MDCSHSRFRTLCVPGRTFHFLFQKKFRHKVTESNFPASDNKRKRISSRNIFLSHVFSTRTAIRQTIPPPPPHPSPLHFFRSKTRTNDPNFRKLVAPGLTRRKKKALALRRDEKTEAVEAAKCHADMVPCQHGAMSTWCHQTPVFFFTTGL